MKINLNEIVKVKLTDCGKKIFYMHYSNSKIVLEKDKEGYSEFQLWELMNIFGEYMGLGFKECFDPLEIIYSRRDNMRDSIRIVNSINKAIVFISYIFLFILGFIIGRFL